MYNAILVDKEGWLRGVNRMNTGNTSELSEKRSQITK
jgi:hypothetical protein